MFQDLEHAADGLANIVLKLIDRFALGIAAREGWDLPPKNRHRVFMDDNGVILHVSILSQGVKKVWRMGDMQPFRESAV